VSVPAWHPGPREFARARVLHFARSLGVATPADLNAIARADPGAYWEGVSRFLGIPWSRPFERALDLTDGLPFARFFVGGRINYAAACLAARSEGDDRAAIVWEGEEGSRATISRAELRHRVGRCAQALRDLGVRQGDRVGVFMPLTPECVVAVLACGLVGAIYTPLFSGYAAEAIAQRLNDAEAVLLITADGVQRRGRFVPMLAIAREAAVRAPSVRHLLVQRRVGHREIGWEPGRTHWWHEIVDPGPSGVETPPADTAADDPFMLIYTSGTTGRPKAIVHVHGGFPIKAAHDLAMCFDVQGDDRVFWLTDLGWMMGPWLIAGTLLLGATMVLYDGAIDYPEADRLWGIAARAQATVVGVAPTAVRALMRHPVDLVRRHDLSLIRALGSTGEPWNEAPWWWFFTHVGGGRCPIVNYTGGTEIGGGILSGSTVQPNWPCGFSSPTPDMAADVLDEAGHSVRDAVGELAIRQPWVGMAAGFWNDHDRYLETYWSTWPDIWRHGDWARRVGTGDDERWYIDGRSDDTIKLAGKRVGPAEVESAATTHPAVAEAVAIGVPDPLRGEILVLLVVPTVAAEAGDALRHAIADHIAAHLGRPLRPARVGFVREIPRTRNAKIVRRLVRACYLGLDDRGDVSAVENLSALEALREIG